MDDFIKWLEQVLEIIQKPLLTYGESSITTANLLAVGLVVVLALFLPALVDHGLQRLARPGRGVVLSESGQYALSRISRYVIWVIAALVGLDYLGLNLSNFALIGGAVGVGIGFGLQNIFSNFISGIVLLMEKTLKVGDFVDLQSGVVGRVAEISIRYTRVTTNDLVDIIVPNSEFINGRVTNWTLNERQRRIHIPFGVAYGSDKDQVREAGLAAARSVKGTIEDGRYQPDVWLVGFGDSSLDFELVVWVDHELAESPGRTQALYLWAIEDELAKRKLQIPFPQRDLHLRSGVLQVRNVGTETEADKKADAQDAS